MPPVKHWERSMKRLVLGALARACPGDAGDRLPPAEALRRILVVRQDRRLGNLVLLTPLLQTLRELAPDAELDVVVPHGLGAILAHERSIDRLVAFDHRGLIRAPWRLGALRRSLRRPPPTVAIDASPPHAFSALGGSVCAVSGARWRLGYARGEAARVLNVLVDPPNVGAQHESTNVWGLAAALGAASVQPPPAIHTTALEQAAARRAWAGLGLDGQPVVAIHPGGRRAKRWPADHFAQIAGELTAAGLTVLVFGGAAERQHLSAFRPPADRWVYAPPTDVRGFAALLERAAVFLGADSGPMHLAAALQVPCVAMFRVDDALRYGPYGSGHRVLREWCGETEPSQVARVVATVAQGSLTA